MESFEDFNVSEILDENETQEDKRPSCSKCMRPKTVCWCPFLPEQPLRTKTHVIILQHRYEEKRRLKTAPMLEKSLLPEKCTVLKGSRFSLDSWDLLKKAYENPNTMLLYPSADAEELSDCAATLNLEGSNQCTLILLDGTWSQAKGIYMKNKWLKQIKQVKLTHKETSQYVIRTQPTENALSTLESAALALSILEKTPELMQILTRPLRGMCDFQMEHGAVKHQSKQYLVENGLYKKQEVKPWDKTGRSRPRWRPKKDLTENHTEDQHQEESGSNACGKEDRTIDQTENKGLEQNQSDSITCGKRDQTKDQYQDQNQEDSNAFYKRDRTDAQHQEVIDSVAACVKDL